MGGSIALADAEEILTRLGLTKLADGTWDVPSFRADLQRHIDLVEEIARVHGLANVPSRFLGTFVPASPVDAAYDADMVLRRRLAALGLHECQTIKLIADAQLADALPLRPLQDGDVIRVKLPLSEDHAVMRPSIVPGLVASAARNVRQQAKSLRFFEMGRVFRNAGGGKAKDQESETLALLLSGAAAPAGWAQAERAADLYDLKGIIAALFGDRDNPPSPRATATASCSPATSRPTTRTSASSPGSRPPASANSISPRPSSSPNSTSQTPQAARRHRATSRTSRSSPAPPATPRWNCPLTTPNAEIEAVIAKLAEPLLIAFECFDVFTDPTGQKLAADRKSVAYRFHYRAPDRTLKTEEIDAAHQKVLEALTKGLGVKFR